MFSVIIPLYNKEQSIYKTIQSVLNQTFIDFEIVVVNDGSTDNSLKIIEQINDPRIRIINKLNGGVSNTRNRGIREAKFELIALIDADDFWEPNFLEEMYSLINDFPNFSLYGSAHDEYENNSFSFKNNTLPVLYRGILNNYFELAKSNVLFWTSAVIIKKEALLAIGGFNEMISIGEDLDVWFRINLNYKCVFYNKVLAHYNIDGPNRAMKKKHDFSKSIMYYLDSYKDYEIENKEFLHFINFFKCIKVFDLLINFNIDKLELNAYISKINTGVLNKKWAFYLKLPFTIKKIIAIIYNQIFKL